MSAITDKLQTWIDKLNRLARADSSAAQKLAIGLAEFSAWLDREKRSGEFQDVAQKATDKPKQDVNNLRCAGRVLLVLRAAGATVDAAVSIHALIPLHRLMVPASWKAKTKPSADEMAKRVSAAWIAAANEQGVATKQAVETAIAAQFGRQLVAKKQGRNGRPSTPPEENDGDEEQAPESDALTDVRVKAATNRLSRILGDLTKAYGDESLVAQVRAITLAVLACEDCGVREMQAALAIFHAEQTKTDEEQAPEQAPEQTPAPRKRVRRKKATA